MSEHEQERFFEYLVEIDSLYSEYFRNRRDHIKSIVQCFGPFNDGRLLYFSSSNLDPYIQRIVTEKHEELFGSHSVVKIVP